MELRNIGRMALAGEYRTTRSENLSHGFSVHHKFLDELGWDRTWASWVYGLSSFQFRM